MHILLVNPPQENMLHLEGPSETVEEIGFFAPLGLLYIAANLQKYLNCEVSICDAPVEGLTYPLLREYIRRKNPDIIGITASTASLLDVIETAELVKDIDDKIHVCIGGAHPFIYPKETLSFRNIDTIVLGEGEKVFLDLIKALMEKRPLDSIKGIGFKDNNGKIIISTPYGYIDNLDDLPFPARELIDIKKYYNIAGKSKTVATLMSSRGCPGRCTFCCTLYKKPRFMSAPRVVEEMQMCKSLGVKEAFFLDDTFNLDIPRVHAICQEIKRKKIKMAWGFKARIDFVTKDTLKSVVMAGCRRIHFGIEAATDDGLKRLKKDITLEQVRNVFKWIKEYDIETSAAFIIGCPEETRQDVLEKVNLAKELNPTFVQFSVLTPYPNTEIYKDGLSRGMWVDDFWRKFAEKPNPGFRPGLWEENLSRKEIYSLTKAAYKKFYLRPKYIAQSILRLKSLTELKRKVLEGLKIMRF